MKDVSIPDELMQLKSTRPFFSSDGIQAPHAKYVAWIDILGADSIMRRSIPIAANFLGKLHTAALKAKTAYSAPPKLKLFPMVDGLYVTPDEQAPLLFHIKELIKQLAAVFIFEEDNLCQFMVRGGVAYGPCWDGEALMTSSHSMLQNNADYTKHILLGPAVTQAHDSERDASPFGIWIHESARIFGPSAAPHTITATHWHWWKDNLTDTDRVLARTLATHLKSYRSGV